MECCRICLSSNNLTSIFGVEEIANKITSVACVDIAQNDGLPQCICLLCKHELDICMSFKEKCESTFAILKEQHARQIKVKEQVILNLLSGGQVLEEQLPERAKKRVLDTVKDNVLANIADKKGAIKKTATVLWLDDNIAIETDENNDELTCTECRFNFPNNDEFCSHLERLHPTTKTQCQVCWQCLPSESALQGHVAKKHHYVGSNNDCFRCKMCFKAFEVQSQLNSHLCLPVTTTTKDYHRCCICEVDLASENELNEHIRTNHQNVEFTWDRSGNKLLSDNALSLLRDRPKMPYVCAICQKAFGKDNELENHLLLHKNLIRCTKEEIYVFKAEGEC